MSDKNRKLLEESIAHWVRMRDEPLGDDQPTGAQCPLCREYYGLPGSHCRRCPIAKFTGGQTMCDETPYDAALDAWRLYKWVNGMAYSRQEDIEKQLQAWRAAADAEIAFLAVVLKAEPEGEEQ